MKNILILFALLIFGGCKPSLSLEEETNQFIVSNNDAICKFVNLMDSIGIIKPKIVFTQSMLETKWWTSAIFKENYNMFGQKVDIDCYAIKKQRGHAAYKSYYECLLAYKCWQNKRLSDYGKVIISDDDYYNFLECLSFPQYPGKCLRYAEDPKYISKLKIINSIVFNGRSCDLMPRPGTRAHSLEPANRALDIVKRRRANDPPNN